MSYSQEQVQAFASKCMQTFIQAGVPPNQAKQITQQIFSGADGGSSNRKAPPRKPNVTSGEPVKISPFWWLMLIILIMSVICIATAGDPSSFNCSGCAY